MRYKILLFAFIASLTLFFVSCEKENSFETNGIPSDPGGGGTGSSSGTAVFDYNGGTGSCTGAVVAGTYTAGTAVGAGNTATVTVNVDTAGTYTITTNTVNGVSFSATGTFSATGAQTIVFTASGTPGVAGTFNYTPGGGGCTFSVSFQAGTTPPPANSCMSCSYAPFCVGSWYKYQTDMSGVQDTMRNIYESSVDTTVSGAPYKKLTATASTSTNTVTNSSYYNCTNGVSTVFAYTLSGLGGSTLSFIKSTPLKANEPVGASWSEVIQNQIGQNITQTFTIKEKGISRTVLGRNYPDVIHVELRQTIDLMGTQIEAGLTQYYYAKNVGVIEMTNESFGLINSQLLEDYYIP